MRAQQLKRFGICTLYNSRPVNDDNGFVEKLGQAVKSVSCCTIQPFKWCCRRELNSRPLPTKGVLYPELRQHVMILWQVLKFEQARGRRGPPKTGGGDGLTLSLSIRSVLSFVLKLLLLKAWACCDDRENDEDNVAPEPARLSWLAVRRLDLWVW